MSPPCGNPPGPNVSSYPSFVPLRSPNFVPLTTACMPLGTFGVAFAASSLMLHQQLACA
jgi:hypothetical protein